MNKGENDISKYLSLKNELENSLLEFIENSEMVSPAIDTNLYFQNLTNLIKAQNIHNNHDELLLFLQLVLNISNNHHRTPDFFPLIERILVFLKEDIKRTLSNSEILEVFLSNKIIILLLLKTK